MEIHKSAEDYLETILKLQQKQGQVRSIDIVNKLGYSKPSVSIAMKKLRESGYISMAPDGLITLNESGLAVARRILDRHRVLSRMLETMGVDEETAAAEACEIEHCISDSTFDKIKAYFEQLP